MGKKDIALVRYFEDEERYADLINGFVFGGKAVVRAEDIMEKNAVTTGIVKRLKKRLTFQKYRDMIRKVVLNADFVLIGLENQDEVHYAMPVRVMLMDAAGYDEQMRRIQRMHRKKRDLRGAEYLGGFSRTDRLRPVITLVLYYGSEPWDGPRDLQGLMEYGNLPEGMTQMVGNYGIHVLEIKRFEHISAFKSDLYQVFGFLQRTGDKTAEKEFTFQNQKLFENMEEDAYDVIAALSGSKELEEAKNRYRKEGGTINMCEAIRGMIEDGRREGIREGIRKGIQRGIFTGRMEKSRTIARNMFLRGMGAEDTAAICEEDVEVVKAWFREWRGK